VALNLLQGRAYDVAQPTGVCALTGRALQPGEPYVATLVEVTQDPDAAGGNVDRQGRAAATPAAWSLKRLDVSLEAWQGGSRPPGLFGYWRSIVPAKGQKRQLFVDDGVLVDLFVRLGEANEVRRQAFRFVLGLILMRKKLLRYEGCESRVGPDGAAQEWWKVTLKGQDGTWELLDPKLAEQQVREVTEQLGEIFESQL
jgi:hypothetical protein